MRVTEHAARLDSDPSRVVARLFLPGESTLITQSRVEDIVDRVLALPPAEIDDTAQRILDDFSERHGGGRTVLLENARAVADRALGGAALSPARNIVLGSAFTAEYAVEGAALCNPSAVAHPDQSGLAAGDLRVAVSLRCIGEGHTSAIGFAEAVIGAGGSWTFLERATPLTREVTGAGVWSRVQFGRALDDEGSLSDLASAVIGALPERFGSTELERAIADLPPQLSMRPDSRGPLRALREMASSAYRASFPPETPLSARVLLPVIAEENQGIEDARFVRFTDEDGEVSYRATYTAYDGQHIAPRLLISPDLVDYESLRLTGSGARNKGVALFPRPVGGRHLAISRTDGENITLAESRDGLTWEDLGTLYGPTETWELIQLGNCGAPIETPEGWLVLTHGVGPLRTYSLGALLLDLDDPSRVIARTRTPLLQPDEKMRDGYVPRVVYSCGGILHADTLWIPVGVGDSRIRVYSIGLAELRASLEPVD